MHTVGLPRTCLGFTNVLCFILAFISFVICAWCAINTEFFEEVNYTVTKSQSVRTIAKFMNLKVWITPITTILMPVGVVAMLTSCCGLLGAGCKVKCAIKSYIFLVSVLSLVGFWLFIISGLYNIYTNNEKTARYMQGSIRHYYGKEDDFFTYIWNYTMVNHECCGAVSYRDFSKSVWRENNPDKLFPVQCCTLANTSSLEPVSKKCNTDEEDEHSHKEIGCMHALRKSIKINKGKIIFYLILLAVLYLVLMLFSYCIIKGEPLLGAMATGFANVLNPKPREETQVIQSRTSLENMIFVEEPPKKVMRVCLGKFHSVWLTSGPNGNEVWCCGQCGRAGGPHYTALRPTPLKLAEPCVSVAITLNSTVLLLESGAVIQYTLDGTENVSQSNTKTPSCIKLPAVRPLMKLSAPLGVRAGRTHAVVWNSRAVYTWGTNLGQLGHPQQDGDIPAPKRVMISMNNRDEPGLELVETGDAATVLTTSRGDVYLLHKFICKKIAIKQINLRQVCVEARVSNQTGFTRVTVLLLTNVGQLLLWQDTTNQLTRCVFGLQHQTIITQAVLTHEALYFTTKHGEAFVGYISRKTSPIALSQPIRKEKERDNKSTLVKFLEKGDCTSVRIMKIPNIYRAVSIAVDGEGLNFACLQIKPTCGLRSVPELSPTSLSKHMESLRETAAVDDLLHDVLFKVGTKLYPAHIYIIATSSEYLYKMYQENLTDNNEKPIIALNNIHPDVFDRILKYTYTGTCDVAELGPCSLKIKKEDVIGKKDLDDIDIEVDVIENSSEISAYEVYSKQNEKSTRKSRNRRSTDTPTRQNLYCDPVRMVQAAAKRLHVKGLQKLLDKFYYRDGAVLLRENATSTKNAPLHWDRDAFPELVDTNVCSKDGMLISAHKCVLAARLEYFNGMFMHSWTESKLLSKVSLPINHSILLPVINFLYTDVCPEVENCDSIDFICNLLIVADQLFITRLREMCEIALANLITLKNCAELCQFAHTYNSTQLKQCCMEFISLNLCSILENRCLDLLEESLLDDITNYYCKFNPIMSSRVITPFFNAPSDEVIDEFAKNFPVDLNYVDEDVKRQDTAELTKKKKPSKKIEYTDREKERMRYESVNSVSSLDLSNETGDITLSLSNIEKDEKGSKEKQEKWIEVPSSQTKQSKVVQARLKAISNAKEILDEIPTESFTKLTKSSSSSAMIVVEPSTSRMSVSPKDSPIAEMARSPQNNIFISHVGPKLSQKQRKKLAMQGNEPNTSLNDYLSDKLNIGSPTSKPKNPWKLCETPIACNSPNFKPVEFDKILTDQKKQKENSSRIMTKSLTLTQLEDKAIEQLERFYNVHEIDDELITVRRIELLVSAPQWIHTAPK